MRTVLIWISRFALLAILLPVGVGAGLAWSKGWPQNWRTASWESSGLLPEAATLPEAQVLVLSARTGRWRGIFAEHMALVVKPEGAGNWTRYDVVGWGNPVRRDNYAADALWYGNRPYVAAAITGKQAARLIPLIEQTIALYPHSERGSYAVWPGPNSNTFVAWVVRNTDGFAVELPPVAIGKDYMGEGLAFAHAPSRTGFAVSAWGVLGVTVALAEGLELNMLGTTIGVDPGDLAVKLPSLGKLSLLDLVP